MPGQNVAHLLWAASARHGGRAAVVERGTVTAYADLRARAAAIAGALTQSGPLQGERVGVLLQRGADAAAAAFGVLAAGGVLVALNELYRPRQLEHALEDAGASWLVSSEDMLERLPRALASSARLLDVGRVPRAGEWDSAPVQAGPDDLAQLIYTSGSTGKPKGVMLSHGNLLAAMEAVTEYLGITADDRIASLMSFSVVYGFSQLLCALGTGAALIVERSPLAQQIATTLRDERVSVLAAVPPLWIQLLGAPAFRDAPLPALRVMTNAGARIPVQAVRSLRRAQPHARLFLMYGLTEAMRSTYLDPADVDAHPDSIGRPMPATHIDVVRDDGTPCAPGEAGELVQRGPTVGLGYWNDPAATARVFRSTPAGRVVHSGDLVRREADGLLYVVGRKDLMIKTLGYRVGPDDVVELLMASGETVEASVTAEPDEQRGERIVAHVVLKPSGSLERLQAFCGAEMPRYMQPARYVVHAALPRTPGGKYDLQALLHDARS